MPRLSVWLAVLAVVAQAVLFEFAMAAQATAAAQERVVAATRHAHHHAATGAPEHDRDAPRHEHGKGCPFCVARATHQAPSLPPGVEVPVPPSAWVPAPQPTRGHARARRRPSRRRSPPSRASVPTFT